MSANGRAGKRLPVGAVGSEFSIVSPELPCPRNFPELPVRVLPGLDEAEGRMVAEWLAKRLPVRAAAGV
jgi:hypothetical protein